LKVASKSRVTWATSVPILVFLASVLELFPMYATDVRHASSLNASTLRRWGHNNNHDDIYSAVIMTEVIARVHSVHLVNVEQRQAAADPQTKPLPDLGSESISSTTTIAIYYYYSARKLSTSLT